METISREKYQISKYINTSFVDVDEVSTIERQMLMKFIIEDEQTKQEIFMQAKEKAKLG